MKHVTIKNLYAFDTILNQNHTLKYRQFHFRFKETVTLHVGIIKLTADERR